MTNLTFQKSEQLPLEVRVREWLSAFEELLSAQDFPRLPELFVDDSHWRDMGAFTWDLGNVSGLATIEKLMRASVGDVKPSNFELSKGRTAPTRVTRSGREVVEAFISFTTTVGYGTGMVRLVDTKNGLKAWMLLTRLEGIVGAEKRRPAGAGFDRTSGQTWHDVRRERSSYIDRDPEVVVVGGGHHGLFSAVNLQELGVDVLVVDRFPRAGDNWRTRYASLALHNATEMVHFPGLPFPDTYPQFMPKDLLADWIETYVEAMQLNYWSSTEFVSGEYHEASGRWQVVLRLADGAERTMRPRHVVMATGGVGGRPFRPELPGLDSFKGDTLHTKEFGSGAAYAGQHVLVVGVGTSGHDTARELHLRGAQVAMLQRSPVTVVGIETADLCYPPAYFDGTPLVEADFMSMAGWAYPVLKDGLRKLGQMCLDRDRELLDALERAGLRIREPENGYLWQVYESFSGYYINVGASELIISGDIRVHQAEGVKSFVEDGLAFNDGTVEKFDAVILATGYMNQRYETEALFGSEIADKVGDIGGFDEVGELGNTYKPTAQPGLWFTSSGFASGRHLAPSMAAMIKGALDGHVPENRYGFIAANGGTHE
ncbi:NAD(P)/FAD-dependent oxidoreductase [Rhodococcus sp. MS16]|uniref:flavin-containing monooxygenase n=1 Tax=Rhodococcus sp. MS16 TaxID=2579941 RepID=UPI001561E1A0|nr:NAD(P)/FAD-dependent oxidoreductase [Rhodococcus sp. MS16]NRI69865.1 NAD(P)/FAD-dependent oxidoreductase [Rhodococcus sp. MS16]